VASQAGDPKTRGSLRGKASHLLPAVQHRAVHLPQARRRDWAAVKLAEQRADGAAEVLLNDGDGLVGAERGHAVLQLGELLDKGGGEQVGARAAELADLGGAAKRGAGQGGRGDIAGARHAVRPRSRVIRRERPSYLDERGPQVQDGGHQVAREPPRPLRLLLLCATRGAAAGRE
jgi:hypothetical protein